MTPLLLAIESSHVDVASLLLGSNANVSAAAPKTGYTPLLLASEKGYLGLVEKLFEKEGSDEAVIVRATRTSDGANSLMLACQNGHLEVARLLLANHAPHFSQLPFCGCTALMLACWKGHTDVVRLLCSSYKANVNLCASGVNPGVKSTSGASPLMIASREGHHAVVAVLLENFADKAVVDSKGKTALWYAAKHPLVLALLR